MNKYLIFRTDRIGDFLLSAILIKNIKRNDKNALIFVIGSEKNFDYIKKFDLVNEVYLFKKNLLSRFKLVKSLRQHYFKAVIIHDGKKRSEFINLFLKKKLSLSVDNKDIERSHFAKIENIIKLLNFNFDSSDLNFLDIKSKNSNISQKKKHIVLHYDEKWSIETYISKYKNIEPTEEQLSNFIYFLKKKSDYNLIITTGLNTPFILKNAINKIKDDKITFIVNSNFNELENIVSQSKLLISCHGAISHVASAYNVKQIDIIDTNILNPYNNWTNHFRNYNSIHRKPFDQLSSDIIKLL
tara:strand:- start:69 stop:965 length:897 start_codon:yes stop_codon:yes gene_type:complete